MSESAPTPRVYTIISNVQKNQWDDLRQTAVSGHLIQAQWHDTGNIVQVFIPDAQYTAQAVDNAIRASGAQDSKIQALGG